MNLVIDIGNTLVKVAVFENDNFIIKDTFNNEFFFQKIEELLKKYPTISHFVISSVGDFDLNSLNVYENRVQLYFITREKTKFPFQNLYATPNTLGIDRMVLSSGAVLTFPKQNRLIIDAGTCITYDFIDDNDNYLGGAISPGIKIRYESLSQQTAHLPFLSKELPESLIGNSTKNAIHSGVVNGILFEIDGFISQISIPNAKFITILSGGDADFLAERLKNTIFANPNFLLESLHKTFQYNQND